MATLNEDEIVLAGQWGLLRQLTGSYCFTGKHSETRARMELIVRLLGGSIHSAVSESTDYLVVPNESNLESSKAKSARTRGTAIITERELCAMILPTPEELRAMV